MKVRRILMSLSGVLICAVSVAIFKTAALGVDPFQSLMSGLDQLIPLSFGTLYVIVNLFLLLFSLIVDRHNIGIATFINLFLLGYITQYTYDFLQTVFVNPSLVTRLLCLLTGIVVICFGSSLYMTADLGVSTYDSVAIVLAYKWKLGKFQFCRVGTDLICVICGIAVFLLGGGTVKAIPTIVGIGTIITAFFMGPLIELFNQKVARPILTPSKSSVD
ncbi:MAG: YitT family protein [Lachnospiraceae bacterium]